MAPHIEEVTGVLNENDEEVSHKQIIEVQNANKYPDLPIVWSTIYKHMFSHSVAICGLYLMFTSAKWYTCLWLVANFVHGTLGTTAGAHRLWSHRSYKAKWPVRLFLAYGHSQNFHMDLIFWAKYHRVHHKYTETDSDPHNAKRGFLFSHIGWTYTEPSAELMEKCNKVDVSDLYQDPIAKFQKKYYFTFVMPLACFIIPTVVPMCFWNETFANAFCLNFLRYILNLHTFFCVNSFTHCFGTKPYDKLIDATENSAISAIMAGEGWHNYHHVFPWDYKASEFEGSFTNYATAFIDLMAKFGLTYDLKSVPPHLIERRVRKTGDGSHAEIK